MPDKRIHRGPNPDDLLAFDPLQLSRLADAESDFSWLLGRGYARRSGLELVGNRYELTERQRTAVSRCACSPQEQSNRQSREVPVSQVLEQRLLIDGFNLLTTVEVALAGGVVLSSRDGCFRDMASMHGHFKGVAETMPALALIGQTLELFRPSEVIWLLDRPVSNSGRLAESIRQIGLNQAWNWQAQLVQNPDQVLAESREIIATADSAIIEACHRWINLGREVVSQSISDAWIVEFTERL